VSCLQCALLLGGTSLAPCKCLSQERDAPCATAVARPAAQPARVVPTPPYLSRAPPAFA
jgi:hypothetical protein